jgi:signal transduction histidine kinase
MSSEIKRWLSARRSPVPSFRLLFTLMYLGVIGAIAYSNTILNCGRKLLGGGAGVLAIIFLLLIGLERFEHWRYRYAAPTSVAIILLFSRMALFEGVAALDCSIFSILLYPAVTFSAYFSFGAAGGLLLSLFYVLVALAKAFWHNPDWYLNTTTVFVLLAFALILLFMQVLARVIHRDEENRHRTEHLLADLEVSHRTLQAYAEQVGELAATEERNRLARDIHDSLGHSLTAVNIQLEKALAFWQRRPDEAMQAIRDAKQAASEALQNVRDSVGALRDVDSRFSLGAALQELAERQNAQGLPTTLTVVGDERDFNSSTLMALYRVTQEGLTNVQKHAGASRVELVLRFGDDAVSLRLHDDGRGFDTSLLGTPPRGPAGAGYGLQGIRERLELVHGQVEIKSDPGQGTELIMTAPRHPVVMSERGATTVPQPLPETGP